jgi:hypothetical protein
LADLAQRVATHAVQREQLGIAGGSELGQGVVTGRAEGALRRLCERQRGELVGRAGGTGAAAAPAPRGALGVRLEGMWLF